MATGKRSKGEDIAFIAGILLCVLGLYELANRAFSSWWSQIVDTAGMIMGYSWPIAIIIAGLFAIHAARTGMIGGEGRKHLTRSTTNRKIAGVCGGIARYFDADPGVVRIIAIVLVVVTLGTAGIIYLLMWLVVPQDEN